MKRTIGTLALSLLVALPAAAGYHYRTETRGEGGDGQPVVIRTEGWVQDGRTKVVFEESGNPLMPAGSYLLIPDATTRKMFLVNPKEKTYSEWNLDAMVQFAGNVMEGLGPIASFQIVNPKIENLLEEGGGSRFGLDLTHYRFRTTYEMEAKILGMKRTQSITQVTDGYYTRDLDDEAFSAWLRPIKTGNDDLDRLIELEMGKNRGFPVEMITEQTTVNKKGKEEITRTSMKVLELGPASPGEEMWVIPSDFKPVPLMPITAEGMEGQDEDDKKKKKGLLGRIRGDG